MVGLLAETLEPYSGEWWLRAGLWIVGAVAAALVLSVVGRRYVRWIRRRAKEAADDQEEGRRLRRRSTVVGLIVGTVQIVAWFAVITIAMAVLGVPLGPLFASAGVVGVALGFGAQTVVRDTLSGLFIALEGQFDVGDYVELSTEGGPVAGTIEDLTLRTTEIRQYDGTLSVVPNGGIHIASNKTRGWGRAIVDVRVSLAEDPEKVRQTIDELLDELIETEPFSEWFPERPEFLGVTQLTDVAQVMRVVAQTDPSHRMQAERGLRERITARMTERGLKVPPVSAMPARETQA